MDNRDFFRFSLLSFTLLLYPFVHPADQRRDTGAPIPGAQYVGSLPNGHGTTEIAPTANMPKGPDINPQYAGQSNSSGKNSSAGGIFGFLWNLGKKSEREIRRDAEIAKMDKILAKAASGIPLSPEEYAFTGAGKMIPQPSIPVAAPTPVATPSPAPTVAAPTPALAFNINGRTKTVCMPGFPNEMDTSLYNPISNPQMMSSSASQTPSIIDKPNIPSLGGWKNPPTIGGGIPIPSQNGSGNGNNGGGLAQGLGGAMAGGGAAYTLMQAAPIAAPATAGGATAGGGTVAVTTGTVGWGAAAYSAACWVATVVIPPVVVGTTTLAVLDYLVPNERNVFFKERARKAMAEKAAQSHGSSSSTTGGNGNNGKDKNGGTSVVGAKESKPRRTQPLSKTEAYAKIKDRYEHFHGNKYRLRDGKEPIRVNGKAVERLEWDHNHGGEWEAYPYKDGGKHLGALDPETLELYKAGVKGRSVTN